MNDTITDTVSWLHHEIVSQPREYDISVPAGLYLSASLANLYTHNKNMGHMEFKGTGLSCMFLREPEQFKTILGNGDTRTFGAHINITDSSLDAPEISKIIRIMKNLKNVEATFKAPINIINQLCSPIDDWYCGDVYELVNSSRQMLLKASVLSWLSNDDINKNTRHTKFAKIARDIIEANIGAKITLPHLSKQVGLNERSLSDAFKNEYDQTIAHYILSRRMDMAIDMLNTGFSVTQTAEFIGYSAPYFTEIFYKKFGFLPKVMKNTNN